jgi:hypothetical protein
MIQGLHIEPYDVPLVFMAPGSSDIQIHGSTVRPHKLTTTPAVLKYLLCTQLNLQVKYEQLKLSKTDSSI